MAAETSIARAAAAVLLSADPLEKVRRARACARDWRLGRIAHRFDVVMPAAPSRPQRPLLLPPSRMPKRGRAGSVRTQIAMLHAIAHIEHVAIDLAFDMAGRFGDRFPRAFVDDWVRVGAEEAMHFALLSRRLRALAASYGDLPAHDGLWEAAAATAHDPAARLAVVPMVLEARGLDVTPAMIERFERAGDAASARILRRIMADEIRHVRTGVRWFESICAAQQIAVPQAWQSLVERHFGGTIKPPFNGSARDEAGLTRAMMEALVEDRESRHHSSTPTRAGHSSTAAMI